MTSAECLAIIKEQDEKKKRLEEEKARKKLEREEKRKQREEEKQKKAQERAQKAEERARKAQEKEREKERKKAEKEQKERQKGCKQGKFKGTEDTSKVVKQSLRSRHRPDDQQPSLDNVIVSNRCCVCFEDYAEEDGVEWVQCPCSRWLHEDCIINTVVNSEGKEFLCPHCT